MGRCEGGVGMYAETSGVANAQPVGMYRSCIRIGNVSIGLTCRFRRRYRTNPRNETIPDDSHGLRYRHKRSVDGSVTKDGWQKAL